MVQRCWAAYALQGRQASALSTTSAVLDRPSSARVRARRSSIPAAGKASGSRKTRMAMYCAVHSPIPRIDRSLAIASSNVWLGLNKFGSARAAAATDDSARARAAGIPSKWACAILSGVGNMCVSPSPQSDRNGSPYLATSFAARFTAATTVICWPSIARTATSKPSQAPGTRRPGRSATRGASSGSRPRSSLIASGSALRSKMRRTRRTIPASALT